MGGHLLPETYYEEDFMKTIDPSLLEKLKLPPMGQLGIVVEDICQAVNQYSTLLNIKSWYRTKIVKHEIHYLGKPIKLDLDIALGYSGSLQFELIQVIQGDKNVYTDLIDSQGLGIHHIGFGVSNLSDPMDRLQRAGYAILQYGTFKTKGKAITRFAYFDTTEQFGYITELIETSFMGVNVGMSRWMMKIGSITGDVSVII